MLFDFMVSCKPTQARHSYMHDTKKQKKTNINSFIYFIIYT